MLTDKDLESETERLLWKAVDDGGVVVRRVGHEEHDDPTRGGSWDKSRSVRARLLIELLKAGAARPVNDLGRSDSTVCESRAGSLWRRRHSCARLSSRTATSMSL